MSNSIKYTIWGIILALSFCATYWINNVGEQTVSSTAYNVGTAERIELNNDKALISLSTGNNVNVLLDNLVLARMSDAELKKQLKKNPNYVPYNVYYLATEKHKDSVSIFKLLNNLYTFDTNGEKIIFVGDNATIDSLSKSLKSLDIPEYASVKDAVKAQSLEQKGEVIKKPTQAEKQTAIAKLYSLNSGYTEKLIYLIPITITVLLMIISFIGIVMVYFESTKENDNSYENDYEGDVEDKPTDNLDSDTKSPEKVVESPEQLAEIPKNIVPHQEKPVYKAQKEEPELRFPSYKEPVRKGLKELEKEQKMALKKEAPKKEEVKPLAEPIAEVEILKEIFVDDSEQVEVLEVTTDDLGEDLIEFTPPSITDSSLDSQNVQSKPTALDILNPDKDIDKSIVNIDNTSKGLEIKHRKQRRKYE